MNWRIWKTDFFHDNYIDPQIKLWKSMIDTNKDFHKYVQSSYGVMSRLRFIFKWTFGLLYYIIALIVAGCGILFNTLSYTVGAIVGPIMITILWCIIVVIALISGIIESILKLVLPKNIFDGRNNLKKVFLK